MVDDLCTTGGTLSSAAKLAKDRGAKSIIACVTHALFTDMAIDRLKKSPIEEVITTDSVPSKDWKDVKVQVLSIAELLGEAILRVHNNQSVTSLFRV